MTGIRTCLLAAFCALLVLAGCSEESEQREPNRPAEPDRGEGRIVSGDPDPGVVPTFAGPATAPSPTSRPEVAILPPPSPTTREVVVPPDAVVSLGISHSPAPRTMPAASQPATRLVEIPPSPPSPGNDPNDFIVLADRALAGGDPNEAVRLMYRAVELDPTSVRNLRGLSVALVAAGRFEESVPIYRAIIGQDANDATARFNLALAASRIRDFGLAEREYRTLVERDALHARAWYNLAMLYQAQGRLEDARQTWLRVLELAPEMASAHALLGEIYLDLGRAADAEASLARAVKLDPNSATTWINFAEASRAAGSYGQALAAVGKAAQLAPKDALVHRRRGELLLELHRATARPKMLADAIAAWKISLALDPNQNELAEKVRRIEPAATRPTAPPAGG